MQEVTIHSQSPSVNTQDLLEPEHDTQHEDIVVIDSVSTAQPTRSKQDEMRNERCRSRLTSETYETLFPTSAKANPLTRGKFDFKVEDIITVLVGKLSQFDSPRSHSGNLFPPTANDCCQTFSAVCAVLLGSCGTINNLKGLWKCSTVNYILYVSAWLHHVTSSVWGTTKQRPNVRDLGQLLHFEKIFPVAPREDFEIIFYNEAPKIRSMVQALCTPNKGKRGRSDDKPRSTCGYLIVSGDYTISIVCLRHDTKVDENDAFALIMCDSHGSPLWSKGKASFLLLNVMEGLHEGQNVKTPNGSAAYDIKTGCNYFCDILFAMLEDNRKENWNILQQSMASRSSTSDRHCRTNVSSKPPPVPYMTWTAVQRVASVNLSPDELRQKIDKEWLPHCLTNATILAEKNKHFPPDTFLRTCFMGM